MNQIPQITSNLYETINAPNSFSELAELLQDVRFDAANPKGWRGQADIDWRLDSSVVRRVNKHIKQQAQSSEQNRYLSNKPLEDLVQEYETKVLNQARSAGFGVRNGQILSDIEIFAVLQHYGAATRFLDFSFNVFVALWFLCQEQRHLDKCGLLIGLDVVESNTGFKELSDFNEFKTPLHKLLQNYPNRLIAWQPTYLFERMRIQQSFFVFGPIIENRCGSIPVKLTEFSDSVGVCQARAMYADSGTTRFIAVSPKLKMEIRRLQSSLFGYSSKSLLPDIEGFSQHHKIENEFEPDFFPWSI